MTASDQMNRASISCGIEETPNRSTPMQLSKMSAPMPPYPNAALPDAAARMNPKAAMKMPTAKSPNARYFPADDAAPPEASTVRSPNNAAWTSSSLAAVPSRRTRIVRSISPASRAGATNSFVICSITSCTAIPGGGVIFRLIAESSSIR